ncbi:MAG: hypothetical protein CMF19_09820 [Idiomarinaceae bacterium]|nr:hypothetical protein [Idiomarinaceae bacterium]
MESNKDLRKTADIPYNLAFGVVIFTLLVITAVSFFREDYIPLLLAHRELIMNLLLAFGSALATFLVGFCAYLAARKTAAPRKVMVFTIIITGLVIIALHLIATPNQSLAECVLDEMHNQPGEMRDMAFIVCR